MAWHIFKKDLRALWALALGVGLAECAAAALRCWLDSSAVPQRLTTVADLLAVVALVGMPILIVAAVHQDAIPGVRQDWLIRPIRRGDLILAKLIFLVLIVQGPMLLVDLGAGLAHGFALAGSIEAAVEHNAAILCMLVLPAMMVALVTQSVMEFLMVALGVILALTAIFLIGVVLLLGIKTSLGGTGLTWIIQASWYVLAVAGTLVVITLQYHTRRTMLGRGLIGAGGAVLILSAFFPWHTAFAIQEKLAPEPQAGRSIALAVDPSLAIAPGPGPGHGQGPHATSSSAGSSHAASPGAASSGAVLQGAGAAARAGALYLPLRMTGVPAGAIVLMDRAIVRIRDMNGRELYEGRTNLSVDGYGSIEDAQFEVRQGGDAGAVDRVTQRIFLPEAVLARVEAWPVRMDLEEFMTLYRPAASYSLPALSGRVRLGGLGYCTTGIDGDGDDVQVNCIGTGVAPSCLTAYLEYPPTGARNPEVHHCSGNYTPFVAGVRLLDAFARGRGELPFFDHSGLAHYPVDGSKLADSRLVLETYSPRDHFTREVSVSGIALGALLTGRTP